MFYNSKDYVVEYVGTQGTTMMFQVWEHVRPSKRARFAVPLVELCNARDAGALMSVRSKTALEMARSQ